MKKFLLNISWIFLLLTFFGVSLEILYTKVPNDYNVKKQFLETKVRDVKVLVLGSSLTWRGINPKYISTKSYNASFAGQSLKYDFVILNKYIESCDSLSDLILCVSYGDFRNTTKKLFPARVIYYTKYFDSENNLNWFISNKRGISMLSEIWLYYKYGFSTVESDCNGFKPTLENSEMDIDGNGKKVAAILTTDSKEAIDENLSYLSAIIDLCEKYNVKVHIITPPFNSSLTNFFEPNQLTEMESICDSISISRTSVFYTNFLYDADFINSDYLNSNHLNNLGAEKLTKKVDSLIISRNLKME